MIFKEEDMEKMISYVFGSLERNERAIGNITNELKKQHRFNKTTTLFAIACTACLIMSDMRHKEDLEKLKALANEVEELKEMKGE